MKIVQLVIKEISKKCKVKEPVTHQDCTISLPCKENPQASIF